MLSSISTPPTTLCSSTTTTFSLGSRNNTTLHDRLDSCAVFAGRPLNRDEAQSKMDRCPVFRQTVSEYQCSAASDALEKAIRVDYGMRLRSCLYARPAAKAHHDGHLPY